MSAPSPGWYPDPTTPGSLRFYDGDQWTKSVVTVPANGQLTPDMIATGRKIMQDKASAKLADGPITPRALGSNDDVGAAASHASSTRSARSAASASPAAHGGSPAATTRSSLRASATSQAAGASAAGANSRAAAATTSAADATASASAESASTANVPTSARSKAAVTPESSTATSAGTPGESSSATQASAGVNTAGKRSAFAPRAFDASALSSSSGFASSAAAGSAASGSAPFSKSQSTGEPSGESAVSEATTTDSVTPKWATDEPQDAHNAAFANDVADSSGTSKSAAKKGPSTKILIIAILVVVAVIAAVLFALLGGKDEKAGAPSAAYKALGLKSDFGCEAIAEEVKELSRSGTNEIPVISLKDISMTNDKRDTFELPTQSGKYTTAFECEGMASYDDGETQKLTFDMSADKAGKLWTYYTPRTK